MSELVDFTNCERLNKSYSGANGKKICIVYNDQRYMLKFNAPAKLNKDMKYANSCVSEYLGCHIFDSIGISVQETILGRYNAGDKERLVVACKDFTSPGIILQDFASLKNQIIDSERNGYGTELADIEETLVNQTVLPVEEIQKRFWDVFIVDALVGNWDRHNGNWGILYNEVDNTSKLAPVFDCGSSMYPQAGKNEIEKVFNNVSELHTRVYNRPQSAITINNKRINYFDFISSLENQYCNDALRRIVPKINLDIINKIIDETPIIDDFQKQFYKLMLKERKNIILDKSLEKLNSKEQTLEGKINIALEKTSKESIGHIKTEPER